MEGGRMTEIGKAPEGWKIVRLEDVVEINKESRDPAKETLNDRFLYIDIESIEGGTGVIKAAKELLGKDAPSRARRVVHQNNVIMSMVRPYLKAFALVPRGYNNQICSTGFAVLSCKNVIVPCYLLYTLFSKNVIDQCNKMMVGGQYPALNQSQVAKIEIPLPPLPEQRRIAEVLGTVDNAIQKVGGAIEKTKRLKKGLMQRLLTKGIEHERFKETEVGRVPEEWEVVQVGNITKEHKQGFYTAENYSEEGINLVRITDLQNPEISYATMPKIKIDDGTFKQFKVDVGDFLIARSGAIGRYGVVKEPIPCIFGSYIIRFRFDNLRIDNLYFGKLFESNFISNELRKITQGATNKNINAQNIKKIKISLPPLPEQRRIAEILSAVDKKLELERRRKEKLERVKKGLMDELLTGRKRIKEKHI
ncbi:restriction endonuclease subunit S [Candidatus Methanoperedens nitratireducens]|uniref:Restriction modification system DNA specificity domain protein n=1 Tax=Candidatus Methanoperedens nitratireducens TaxID=1392998 RepID=A0A284VT10_9EURY|nr:restriction endonuclease subunit S [Candidatus Methanoperedens nitroreducens]SNQ62425.1 Restriction modification system DNA specificity domain protein [Candidatus Methanoperedens nitroreducens]